MREWRLDYRFVNTEGLHVYTSNEEQCTLYVSLVQSKTKKLRLQDRWKGDGILRLCSSFTVY